MNEDLESKVAKLKQTVIKLEEENSAISTELTELKKKTLSPCVWTSNNQSKVEYYTSCGEVAIFQYDEDNPDAMDMKYCFRCGRRLVVEE